METKEEMEGLTQGLFNVKNGELSNGGEYNGELLKSNKRTLNRSGWLA
jgi:hypothetical protein